VRFTDINRVLVILMQCHRAYILFAETYREGNSILRCYESNMNGSKCWSYLLKIVAHVYQTATKLRN